MPTLVTTTRTSWTQRLRQPAPLRLQRAKADTDSPPAESCTCSVFALVGLILPLLVACVRWMGWPLPDKLLLQALCNGSGLLSLGGSVLRDLIAVIKTACPASEPATSSRAAQGMRTVYASLNVVMIIMFGLRLRSGADASCSLCTVIDVQGSNLLWWAEVANGTSLVLSLCRVALQCRHCRRRKAAEESLQSTLGMQEKKDTKVKANENKNSKKSNAHGASRGNRLLSLPQKAAGNVTVARS